MFYYRIHATLKFFYDFKYHNKATSESCDSSILTDFKTYVKR